MKVPSNSPRESNPRLYNGVINTLELIRALGLTLSVLYAMVSIAHSSSEALAKCILLALMIYISMTSCIAIIDLLSRIEYNTRKSQ